MFCRLSRFILSFLNNRRLSTLRVCAEDSYTDTPFRERGLYAGDMLPQMGVTLAGSADLLRLVKRSLRLFQDMYIDQFQAGAAAPSSTGLRTGSPSRTTTRCLPPWPYLAGITTPEQEVSFFPLIAGVLKNIGEVDRQR